MGKTKNSNVVYIEHIGLHRKDVDTIKIIKNKGDKEMQIPKSFDEINNNVVKKVENTDTPKAKKTRKTKKTDNTPKECIAIFDVGMGCTKFGWINVKGELEMDKVPSRVKMNIEDGMELVMIDNRLHDFRCSTRVQEETGSATKATEHHKALMRKGLYEIHKKTGAKEFKVMAACSLDSYVSQNKGEDVLNMLWDSENPYNNNFKIGKFGGEQVELKVKEVKIKPETLSGIVSMGLKLKGRTVVGIDIGHYNFAMLPVKDLVPDYAGMHFSSEGMSSLIKTIVRNGNASTLTVNGRKLNENDVELIDEMMQDLEAHPDKVEYIKTGVLPFLKEIETILADKYMLNSKSKNLTLAFLGGGCETLKPFIQDYFEDFNIVIAEDAQFATLRGIANRAVKEFKEEKVGE